MSVGHANLIIHITWTEPDTSLHERVAHIKYKMPLYTTRKLCSLFLSWEMLKKRCRCVCRSQNICPHMVSHKYPPTIGRARLENAKNYSFFLILIKTPHKRIQISKYIGLLKKSAFKNDFGPRKVLKLKNLSQCRLDIFLLITSQGSN